MAIFINSLPKSSDITARPSKNNYDKNFKT